MAGLNDLLELIPVDQIATQLGVDPGTAKDGIDAVIPAILGGLGANAKDPAGAASLGDAIASKDGSLLDGGIDLGQIDTADGEKIVKNVFGENTDAVAAALGSAQGGQSSDLVKKLLPMLAPLVMSFLGKKAAGSTSGGSGLQDLLGGLLGGGTSSAATGGGGLDDLIGGLLGGGGGAGAGGGGLGDLLGGLLGAGKR